MDVAYNQHANAARRKNRSTTHLNHLSLAPLTSRLPLNDHDELLPAGEAAPGAAAAPPSYLQGKSAPTTPRLLSRSPGPGSRSIHSSARLPKSKSTTHLVVSGNEKNNGRHTHNNGHVRRKKGAAGDESDRSDADWLLRAGALISSETRESKGQSWLVSRASSTSLAVGGIRDAEEEAFERELARERGELDLISKDASRNASRNASRRGSLAGLASTEEDCVFYSPTQSRFGSRSQSRVGSRSQMMTPAERRSVDGYFPASAMADEDTAIPGPDFINLDEKLETIEQDTSVEDEAHVRRLVKRGNAGGGTWLGNVLAFRLFSVEEDEEESEVEGEATEGECEMEEEDVVLRERRIMLRTRKFDGVATSVEERMPPPKPDEGGWQDAAWLLTVASKVLL